MPDPVARNQRRAVLLAVLVIAGWVLVGLVVGALVGRALLGVLAGAVLAGGLVGLASWKGDAIVLAVSRAEPADPREHARYHNLVEGLCVNAGVAVPRLFVVHDPAANAMVTGARRSRAGLAVTTGLLDRLGRVELEGVVAHELSHLKGLDTLPSSLAVLLVAWPVLLADVAVRTAWWNGGRVTRPGDRPDRPNPLAWIAVPLYLAAPLCSWGIRLAVRPQRELAADAAAVQLTRYPPALIEALGALRDVGTVTHAATTATAHLWMAQPLSGLGDEGRLAAVHRWFDTHPPLDERIALLEEL